METLEVKIGEISIGGKNPIRVQSMINLPIENVSEIFTQIVKLCEVGCEIVRLAIPNKNALEYAKIIKQKLRLANYNVPLVADVHFLPNLANEALEVFEKVRINPGNFVQNKIQDEKERVNFLEKNALPFFKKAKKLGRSVRIGVNHGSLGSHILNKYGNTPLGMFESALEFIKIAESIDYKSLVLSFKSSNVRIMLETYRLAFAKMTEFGIKYPLHLGVTEAGFGQEARIKSAIGIGTLLTEGIGDTIRVSLTEDPVNEIFAAKNLISAVSLLKNKDFISKNTNNSFEIEKTQHFSKAENSDVFFDVKFFNQPNILWTFKLSDTIKKESFLDEILNDIQKSNCDGILISCDEIKNTIALKNFLNTLVKNLKEKKFDPKFLISFDFSSNESIKEFKNIFQFFDQIPYSKVVFYKKTMEFLDILSISEKFHDIFWAVDSNEIENFEAKTNYILSNRIIETYILHFKKNPSNQFFQILNRKNKTRPFWLRSFDDFSFVRNDFSEQNCELDEKTLSFAIFLANLAMKKAVHLISLEKSLQTKIQSQNTLFCFQILQACRSRMTQMEFISCPGCGRTQFDLESTAKKIHEHFRNWKGLKGKTIAVMGCCVNGPGEMADADFGYVGSGPGKINLFRGQNCVKTGISSEESIREFEILLKNSGINF